MRRFALLAGVVLVSGCASMSKEECLYADWGAIGYEDGAAGRPVSAVSPRRQACAKKAGVTVDMAAYRAGREEGLALYCEPANGYAVGANGGRYYGVCSGRREDAFLAAYETGRRLYQLESAVAGLEADIRQAQIDLNNVEHHIARTESALISPATPHVDRLELLAELKHLSEEKGNVETALIALSRDHARAEYELAAYRDELAYNDFYTRGALSPTRAGY